MGRLTDFRAFIHAQIKVLRGVETRLCAIQEHYETFYGELSRVRDHELDQLEQLVQQHRDALPGWLSRALEQVGAEVEEEIDGTIASLQERIDELTASAEARRERSATQETRIRRRNVELDRREEQLKERNERLLADIADYNRQIRELSSGFGFLLHLPDMRRLRRERVALDHEQRDVAAHIEALRAAWAKADAQFVAEEERRAGEWQEARNAAAELAAQLQWTRDARERLIYRTTLERAIAAGPEPELLEEQGNLACARCAFSNPAGLRFCQVCGQRMKDDRTDLDGSLGEIAEAARMHARFSQGMEAGQQLIGLVRGLISGHEAFVESIEDMIETERTYPVSKLQIEVPQESRAFTQRFAKLAEALERHEHLHPLSFTRQVRRQVDGKLSEGVIQDYFERMGTELSNCAEDQW